MQIEVRRVGDIEGSVREKPNQSLGNVPFHFDGRATEKDAIIVLDAKRINDGRRVFGSPASYLKGGIHVARGGRHEPRASTKEERSEPADTACISRILLHLEISRGRPVGFLQKSFGSARFSRFSGRLTAGPAAAATTCG